jgi:hypothetical protein
MQVDCYDFRNDQAGDPSISFGDFARIGRISDLLKYDAIMSQVGNNPHFHLDILKLLRLWPGIVVLHDVVLYYLFAGFGLSALLKYPLIVEGRNGLDSLNDVAQSNMISFAIHIRKTIRLRLLSLRTLRASLSKIDRLDSKL